MKTKLFSLLLSVFVIALVFAAIPTPAHANGLCGAGETGTPPNCVPLTTSASCSHSFFGLMPWYQYISKAETGGDCNIKCFNVFTIPKSEKANDCGQRASDIPLVLLAVVDDLLRIAGLVALGFIIYAAFNFITSQGNPEDAAKARTTAINALVGLIIAMFAVALVSFIGKQLGG